MPIDSKELVELIDKQRRTMNLAILTAVMMVVSVICLGGNVLTLAVIKLGAEERFIGFINFAFSIPFLLSIFTISTMERIGKRNLLLIGNSIAIFFILPILFIPIIRDSYSSNAALVLLLFCTFCWRTAACMGNTGWFPILHDNIPNEMTGRYFAKLRIYYRIVWLIILFFLAWFLKGSESGWWKFEIIFIMGFTATLLMPLCIIPMSESPVKIKHYKPKIIQRIKDIFSRKKFRVLIFYLFFYQIAFSLAEPFKVKYLKDLGYSESYIIGATALIGLGAVVSLRFWGRLADKFGNRGIFSISHIGMIIVTLMWTLVNKSIIGYILTTFLYLLLSIFNAGNGIARTRYTMHAVSSEKQFYIIIIDIFAQGALAIGPVISGFFLHSTENLAFSFVGVQLENYRLLFIVTAILFIVPHVLRKKLRMKKETSTAEVLDIVIRPLRNAIGSFIRIRKLKN